MFTALAGAPDALDEDADGLSTIEERHFRTDPLDADSDSDGLLDGIEAGLGLNPMRPDTDNDGRPDGLEIMQGTDPRIVDSLPPALPEARVSVDLVVVPPEPIIVRVSEPSVTAEVQHLEPRRGTALPAAVAIFLLALLPSGLLVQISLRGSNMLRSLHGIFRPDGTHHP